MERLLPHSPSALRDAIPIYCVREKDAEFGGAPESLRRLAGRNRFEGDAGQWLVGDEGVLFGIGGGRDPLIAAALGDRLPAGAYYFADQVNSENATLTCFAWLLGGYRFSTYKSLRAAEAVLVAPAHADIAEAQRAYAAVRLVRDLVNTPAGDMTPAALESAAAIIAENANVDLNSIVGDDLLTENYPMVHAVGRAADAGPRIVEFVWGDPDAPKVTLVGKGVCFDSGGLNIKGSGGMALMKKDMGGAAHVLALSQMIIDAGLNVRLRTIAPLVENAIAGNAFRPGDILKTRKGITVEIGNTDAEGRLILGDALVRAGEDDPELTISMATLTGAARVAVGPELAPYYCDDNSLCAGLEKAAEAQSDPVWRMPLWRNYASMLSSKVADINHISSGGFAGSITAALFLQRFAPATGVWMHFDIYAWRPSAAPGRPVGGEAQGVRAIFAMLAERYGA
ncbi:MAG: leucyl aminopeptidase family protein [Pseudomonadota bacterium]